MLLRIELIENYTGVPGAHKAKNCTTLFESGQSESLSSCRR
ncbi:conserved hypothetical protein [Xenorhabdus innexi]|uniref:Uncharacterized protein n=1 Tax=Xenorhabdus innexi TaxID=290109 RepID=A0A1N6N0Q7_9GAMM|nr:conserved hypothetical protein [Xenorhabdus innexi]